MSCSLSPELTGLLEQTSRTFYKTLKILPAAVRPQISLAYLLARTTDTIADTDIVSLPQRLEALDNMRRRILGQVDSPLNFGQLANQQGLPAERALLKRVEVSLAALRSLASADLELVREVLATITSGQESDLRRFARSSVNEIIALRVDAELDDYTYRVAGCVGEFWTRICRAHLFPTARLDDARLLADGVRFGKGLQLVNILRDLAPDLRKGRCYLPAQPLYDVTALRPTDLLDPANEERLRPVYNRYLDLAESHLAAGWTYTNALPWRCVRVRLACAWPILIGVRTIGRLRTRNPLDPEHPIKIQRAEVRSLLLRSVLLYPLPKAWGKLVAVSADATGKAIASASNLT